MRIAATISKVKAREFRASRTREEAMSTTRGKAVLLTLGAVLAPGGSFAPKQETIVTSKVLGA